MQLCIFSWLLFFLYPITMKIYLLTATLLLLYATLVYGKVICEVDLVEMD